MSSKLIPLSLTATLLSGAAFADVPQVAVDIAPVHSLVSRVMVGVGTPELIVQSGANPHEYSLRPSEARAIQDAQIVFWIGADLTPWLTEAIETLAPDAAAISLLEADGTIELEFRESALFETHDHSDHDDHEESDEGHNEHGHDDHSEEKYAEDKHDDHSEHKHEDHDDHTDAKHDDHAAHDDHGHSAHDPHAWLSPQNAKTWLNVIAGQLSAADPENAGAYFANAAAGRTEIDSLIAEVNATLEPARAGQFIVFHDAYQYFENDFNFPASGAISIGDASDPSPARIAEIQARISNEGIDCVLSEPQFNAGLVATVMDGAEAKTGILDPLGSDFETGATLYPQLIRNLAKSLVSCLKR